MQLIINNSHTNISRKREIEERDAERTKKKMMEKSITTVDGRLTTIEGRLANMEQKIEDVLNLLSNSKGTEYPIVIGGRWEHRGDFEPCPPTHITKISVPGSTILTDESNV